MSWRRSALHLAALWTIAFVQPLFDVLGKNAVFFVARDNTAADVLIFAFGWALVPPLLAAGAVRVAGRRLHLALVAVLAGVIALQIVKGLSPHASVVLPLAALLGIAAALLYARAEPVRTFVSILGVAPAVVLALFLLASPVNGVIFEGQDAAAPAGTPARNPVPVVLLIFDELPAPSLMKSDLSVDAQRYPNFAQLASTSTWYRNASSVSDGTYVAVPAILTGKRPQAQLPTSHAHPDNLFTLLGRNYAFRDEEPVTKVCPVSLCGSHQRETQGERLRSLAGDLSIVERRLLLPEGMADRLPPIDRDWEDFQAQAGGSADLAAGTDLPSQRLRAARAVVSTMRPGGPKPGLWMVHYEIPHVPWRFLPDGSQYVVSGPSIPGLNDQTWGRNPFLLDQAFQRHLLMVRFADKLLGEAKRQMQRTGLWDKALVIVVGDHGGAIGPGESRRPVTTQNFPEVANVPFFVKLPGQRTGGVKDTFVTTLDVLPTIAKVLGVRSPFRFDGVPVDAPHTAPLLRQRNGREARLVGVAPRDFVARRDAEVRARDRRWPPGNAAIWDIGPRPELIGRTLDTLQEAEGTGGSGFLDQAALFRDVKPGSGVLPVYLTGALRNVAPGTQLAAVVNGRVAATGEAYRELGDDRFSMLVPPRTLRAGRNSVQIVALHGRFYDVIDTA